MNRLIIIMLLISGCQNTEIKKAGKTRDGLPDAESWKATITLTNKGSKRAVIKSGHLEKYQQRQYILLDQNVDANFFNNEAIESVDKSKKISVWIDSFNSIKISGSILKPSNSINLDLFSKVKFSIISAESAG